jgi:hypothetical protein
MADSATIFKDPQLTDRTPQPKGVLQKNLKTRLMSKLPSVSRYETSLF